MQEIKDLKLEEVRFLFRSNGTLTTVRDGPCAFIADVVIGLKAKPGKINPDDEDREFKVTSLRIGDNDVPRQAWGQLNRELWELFSSEILEHIEEELAEMEDAA